MARTYKRDSRGRFASGGSSSSGSRRGGAKLPSPTKRAATGKPQRRQGLLTQRSSLARSQAKLKGKDTADKSLTAQLSLRAQKAAVTRAKNKLAAAQKTGRVRLSGRDGVIRPRKGGARKAAKPTATKAKPRQSSSAARGERIISRFQAIGQGRTGRKARQAQIVKKRAEVFYRGLAPSVTYERGAKAGQRRPRGEVLSGLVKNLQDRKRVRNSRLGFGPASGIKQRLQQQNRRGNIHGRPRLQIRAARSALGYTSDSQYRQRLAYGGTRPQNKIDTSVAVRRRAMEFLANPRSGQKLPALSRPAPQKKATAAAPKPSRSAPMREGVKLTYAQRLRADRAKATYGVKSTGGRTAALSSGGRIRIAGRSLRQAARAQVRQARAMVNSTRYLGEAPRGMYRQRTNRSQLNLFTGKPDLTYGRFRRVDRATARPTRRPRLGLRRVQR